MAGGIFRSVRTYLVAIAIVGIAAMLVSTIFFTQDNLPWTAFLTGVLIASVLAEAARASRSEWVLLRRTAQLSAMKEKFELESRLRKLAEGKIADDYARLQLVDETISTMIMLVDTEGLCRYHNRAIREWLHLKAELINGRHIRELFGPKAYAGIATAIRQTLDGQTLHYEHVQEMSGGAVYRLAVEQIPQFDAAGKVTGVYLIADDITRRGDLVSSGMPVAKPPETAHDLTSIPDSSTKMREQGKMFLTAIQAGDFCLYCQLISGLPIASGGTAHYEILIRLLEEEGSMIPPGGFFPMAERAGLMPYLDRWVVQHVLEWAVDQNNFSHDRDSLFFINVAAATIGDPEFPEFLQDMLSDLGMPGSTLCFEVTDTDLLSRGSGVAEFARQVRTLGCSVALCGFGRNAALLDHIRGFQVDFFKIDGGTVLNMLSNPDDLARIVSIDRVAKKIGVKTIAELVERDEIVEKLGEIGIDFAQGFGISRPRPLK